jgi:hypothetical protein
VQKEKKLSLKKISNLKAMHMRKFTLNAISVIAFLMLFFFSANSQNPGQTSYNYQQGEKCGTMDWLNAMFREYPNFRAQYEENERKLGEAINKKLEEQKRNPNAGQTEAITYIPVVFHVVLTAAQQNNVTNAMIQAQLDTLNKDFSGFNADSANIPPQFQAVRGHSNYLFCLAQRTPTGQPTTGIVRVASSTLSSGPSVNDPIKSTAQGGSDAWDPTKYINIWLGNFSNPSLLGYATFPIGSPENPSGPLNQQGVVCLAQSVPGGTAAPYNRGRTATHELGHFFWLRHIWGDGNCANDFPNTPGIDDTPSQSNPTFGCPAQAPNVAFLNTNCAGFPNPPGRMYQNYMDYTDDACMTMFTNGQNIRAEMAINMFRPGLLTSDGCLAPSGFQFNNPAAATSACPAPASMNITLNVIGNGGFSNPVTLSASGNPPGTTVSFSTNPVTPTASPGTAVTVTLNGTNTLNFGSYVINVLGTATGAPNQNVNLTYTINQGAGPSITAQPSNQTICAGGNTSFSITSATATSFQWQLSTDGGANYNNVSNGGVYSGATTATLNITGATAGMNNYRYRCIAFVQCGASTSAAGILTVNTAPSISGHPQNMTLCAGSNHTFNVSATGNGLTYQWQEDAGSGFVNVTNGGIYSGATTASLTLSGITAGMNSYKYRCVVSGTCPPNATSNEATMTVNTPVNITSQPSNSTICETLQTSFAVSATGTTPGYQWQLSTNGGSTWNNIANGGVYSGATTSTLTLTGVTSGMSGYQYRCVVNGAPPCGSQTSNAATLDVNTAPVISTHPSATVRCAGDNFGYSVIATGTALSYQWQVSTDGGANWNNLADGGVYSGSGTSALSISGVLAAMNGYSYRCVVSGTCSPSATSNAAALTVNTPIAITDQPSLKNICATGNTNFSVTATGTSPTYQWQLSTNGGTSWNNIANGGVYSGVTTPTLSLANITADMNGNLYRVVITGAAPCGSVNSAGAALNVTPQPVITASPFTSLLPGRSTTLSVNITPAPDLTFAWTLNGNPLAGATGNSVVATVTDLGNYQVTITNTATGVSCQSQVRNIKDSASSKLFIFPSPNNGQFTVSYYNPTGVSTSRTVTIYDSRGARVYNRRFTISGPYTLIQVDLRPAQGGIYQVVVGDAGGNKLISGKVMVAAQ